MFSLRFLLFSYLCFSTRSAASFASFFLIVDDLTSVFDSSLGLPSILSERSLASLRLNVPVLLPSSLCFSTSSAASFASFFFNCR